MCLCAQHPGNITSAAPEERERSAAAARAMPDVAEPEIWEGGGRRYRMEKVVGNGAFGVVWRATEEGSTERVAIKKVRVSTCMAGFDWPRDVWRGAALASATGSCCIGLWRNWGSVSYMAALCEPHTRAFFSLLQSAPLQVVLDRRYHNRELEMMKSLEHDCVIRLHHHFEKP